LEMVLKVLEEQVVPEEQVEVQIFMDLLDLQDHQAYPVLKATEAYLEQRGQMGSKVLQENKEVLVLKDLLDLVERLDHVDPKGSLDHLDPREK